METRYGAPVAGGEKEALAGFLDHYRQTLLDVCSGLSDEQLRRPMVPSGTSLLSIVKHLSYTERGWFQERVVNEPYEYPFDTETNPDGDWVLDDNDTGENVFEMYGQGCDRSKQPLEEASLDDLIQHPHRSADYNVRRVVLHMIEETARHVGHADILREQLDGRMGTGYTR